MFIERRTCTAQCPDHAVWTIRFVDAPAALGYAALHLAVGHGHRRAVEALLEGGADPRVRCLGRMFSTYLMPQRFKPAATPLHVAAVRGDLSICVAMLRFQVGYPIMQLCRQSIEGGIG